MGDLSHMSSAVVSVEEENNLNSLENRLKSFEGWKYSNALNFTKNLALNGFIAEGNESYIKCFHCKKVIDVSCIPKDADFASLHKELNSDCQFAQTLKPQIPKTFASLDSLRYERERLETFIDWPVEWLSPQNLAADGFYYLRTADHTACAFCRGIVGAWEKGDSPRSEHKRHFPSCPFINAKPVGNVPLHHGDVLAELTRDKLRRDGNSVSSLALAKSSGVDVCGNQRIGSGSYPECIGPSNRGVKVDLFQLSKAGLREYCAPKCKDYITYESRLQSFRIKSWPSRVSQKPEELAEAGFYYIGLSDHVRCFHCGNGLRNWECNDKPWEEHARWYPDCSFVLIKMGKDFVNKVQNEKPPCRRFPYHGMQKEEEKKHQNGVKYPVQESQLDVLMELDLMKAVQEMGFSSNIVRTALRRKLEETGAPFFSQEPCIEAVLQVMEEQTALYEAGGSEGEEALSERPDVLSTNGNSNQGFDIAPNTEDASVTPPLSLNATEASPASVGATEESPAVINPENTSPSLSSELMEVQEQSSAPGITGSRELPVQSEDPEVSMEVVEPASSMNGVKNVLTNADQALELAEKALNGSYSQTVGIAGLANSPAVAGIVGSLNGAVSQKDKNLEEELEKLRESRQCRLCMDSEMSVLFLPCTHMVACSNCAVLLGNCPICREKIQYAIKPIVP